MKAGLDRSETSFGIDLCLLLWEEQVGRSSLAFFLFELSVCIFESLSVLAEFLYDNLCNVSPQFLLFSFQLQWKLWCFIPYFFSLSVADTGIFSHVENILLTALESEVLASTEEV